MKNTASLLLLSLAAVTGAALAGDPPKASSNPAPTTSDHSKMSHGEHATNADAFAALDANKDGFLSKAELAKHPMAAHAGMVDSNKDGKLSKSEFAALEGM
jgi:hypothetical protein